MSRSTTEGTNRRRNEAGWIRRKPVLPQPSLIALDLSGGLVPDSLVACAVRLTAAAPGYPPLDASLSEGSDHDSWGWPANVELGLRNTCDRPLDLHVASDCQYPCVRVRTSKRLRGVPLRTRSYSRSGSLKGPTCTAFAPYPAGSIIDRAAHAWAASQPAVFAAATAVGAALPPSTSEGGIASLAAQRLLLCLSLLWRTGTLTLLGIDAPMPIAALPVPLVPTPATIDDTAAAAVAGLDGKKFL